MGKKDKRRIKALEEDVDRISVAVHGIEAELATKSPPTESFRTSSPHIRYFDEPIYVTADQAKSMSDGDTWIMAASDDGWLLIGNGSVPHDEEGNGVWHDARGDEHDGPVGSLDKLYRGTD